jgi:SagB-type dehydrogenase family enzyme
VSVFDARPTTDVRPQSARDGGGLDPVLMLRAGVRAEFSGELVDLLGPVTSLQLRPIHGGVHNALRRLADGPVALSELVAPLGHAERTQFEWVVHRAGLLLAHSIRIGGRELCQLEQTARSAEFAFSEVAPDVPVRLSRFAFCRSLDDQLVLESPLVKLRMWLTHPATRELVGALGTTSTGTDLASDELSVADVRELLGHLVGAGFVAVGDAREEDSTLRQWDFHDLLFHGRVRSGRYDDAFGAVYPYLDQIDPQPAVKPPPTGPAIPLYRPSLDEVLARDPVLTAVIEGRRSIRDYAEQPMSVRQLGEFLYRTARTRAHFVPGPGDGDEVAAKPYPSGGGAYELELYLSVRRCTGLDPGIYYYDPVAHQLILVNSTVADLDAMLTVASLATGLTARPDVLITMTSRIQRLSWKYRTIAYATTLRHTGVLYQTMYLVATALGLAPCGLGNGDADLAARVLNLDYLRETSVGDFMLGSRAPDDVGLGAPEEGWQMLNNPDWLVWAQDALR